MNTLPYLMKMEEVTLHPLKIDFIYFKWLELLWHLKHFHESPESSTGLTTALPVCSIKDGSLIHHLGNSFSVFLNISTSTTSQLFLQLLHSEWKNNFIHYDLKKFKKKNLWDPWRPIHEAFQQKLQGYILTQVLIGFFFFKLSCSNFFFTFL